MCKQVYFNRIEFDTLKSEAVAWMVEVKKLNDWVLETKDSLFIEQVAEFFAVWYALIHFLVIHIGLSTLELI